MIILNYNKLIIIWNQTTGWLSYLCVAFILLKSYPSHQDVLTFKTTASVNKRKTKNKKPWLYLFTLIYFLGIKYMHPWGVNLLSVLLNSNLTSSPLSHYLETKYKHLDETLIYFSQKRIKMQEAKTTAYESILSMLDTIKDNYISVYILLYS